MTNPNPNPNISTDIIIEPQFLIDYKDDNNYVIIPLVRPDQNIVDNIDNLPKPIIKIINVIANKCAINYSKINNLNNYLEVLDKHKETQTFPDSLMKEFKNILKDDEETKALILKAKLEQIIKSKSLLLIEEIKIFNNRQPLIIDDLEYARTIYQYTNREDFNNTITTILDYYISSKLIEFDTKQKADKLKKEAKKEKLEKKKELDNIPLAINTKDFKKLQDKILNLEKKLKTVRNLKNPNPKPKPKPRSKDKLNSKNKKGKHFPKGRQSKSQTTTSQANTTRRN